MLLSYGILKFIIKIRYIIHGKTIKYNYLIKNKRKVD